MKYRKPKDFDSDLLAKWISCDESHAATCDPSFWTEEDRGKVECFAVEDDAGTVFYTRAENIVRLHIQFMPAYSRAEKLRLAKAVDKFTEDIKKMCKGKYKQIIFESTSEPLIAFLEKRGFRASKTEIVCDLD